jgi:4-hydroxythreonine-4-phosphate dehydrogenase
MAGIQRLALTPGEPAGVGPDLVVRLAQESQRVELVAVADPDMLLDRARALGLPLRLLDFDAGDAPEPTAGGALRVLPVALGAPVVSGRLDVRNGPYVVATLATACDGCLFGRFDALVTGPVHKGILNDAGIPFTGHTEFLAARCGAEPVMLLATTALRVALATTHLPLSQVCAAIDRPRLTRVIEILYRDLVRRFGIDRPRMKVVLAYSGGLDTSVILKWLQDRPTAARW